MNAKIILAAVLLAVGLNAVHPALAIPKANAINEQMVVKESVGVAPIRGDLHVFLKAF